MNKYEEILIEKAIETDAKKIMNLIQTRCKWLDNNNINQWNVTRTYKEDYYLQKIKQGETYVAKLDDKIVGSFMLENKSLYYENRDDIYHINHLVTDLGYNGVGKEIIDKIQNIAKNNSKQYLRLDNIGSNEKLNQYYESVGFKKIGVIEAKNYDGTNYGILRELKIY